MEIIDEESFISHIFNSNKQNDFEKIIEQFIDKEQNLPYINTVYNISIPHKETEEIQIKSQSIRDSDNGNSLDIKRFFLDDRKSEFKNIRNYKNIRINNNQVKDKINKPKLFQTKKIDKDSKLGRKRKKDSSLLTTKHDKTTKDDITQKIINHFVINMFNKINKEYIYETKKNKPLIYIIKQKAYQVFSKDKMNEFFSLKVEELFSTKISKRCSNIRNNQSKFYNKIQIELLKKENKAKNTIEILNTPINSIFEKYIKNELGDFSLDNDLIEIEKKNTIEYKNSYQKIAKNLLNRK